MELCECVAIIYALFLNYMIDELGEIIYSLKLVIKKI